MKLYIITVTLALLCGCAVINRPEIGSTEWWAARDAQRAKRIGGAF